ncbi:hypothetical protein BREVUG8_10130 [Brevundimonas sp. G8]|nr:hypothetical protein BREVUG8_10130 [Brevundimonas sp. G8]
MPGWEPEEGACYQDANEAKQ